MSRASYLEQCLKSLRKKNPTLAILLALTPPSQGALKPVEISLPSDPTRLLFYGLYPKSFKPLIHWLEERPKREIVLFENQLEQLRALLSLEGAHSFLEHPRVYVLHIQNEGFWKSKLREVQKRLSQPYELIDWPSDDPNRRSFFNDLKARLLDISIDQNINCSEYLHTSLLVYENFLHNLFEMGSSKNLHGLKGRFCNIPGILTGAGPSLYNSAPLLQKLQDKALIFSGGRALSTLNHLEIEPHFALGVDPYSQHKQTLKCNNFFELPLIYRSRMHHEAVKQMHGPRLYTSGAIGYSFMPWIEKKLGLTLPNIQEGLNVVNFSLVIAYYLGCSPIILVGSDLGYTEGQAYSKAIPDEQYLPEAYEVDESDHSLNRGMVKKDHQGRPIFTLWKWSEEAKWLEEYASSNQINLINATDEGLRIGEITHMPLNEVEATYLTKSLDLRSKVHAEIENLEAILVDQNELARCLDEFKESQREARALLKSLLSQEEKELMTVYKLDLEQNEAFHHLLKPLEALFDRLEVEEDASLREKKKYEFLLRKLEEYEELFERFLAST